MMTQAEFDQLLQQWLDGHATEEETRRFLQVFREDGHDQIAREVLDLYFARSTVDVTSEEQRQAVLSELLPLLTNTGNSNVHPAYFLRKWWWAAASVLLLLSIGFYLWTDHPRQSATGVSKIDATEDIAPGKTGAILTLADGSQRVLDSMGNGIIAEQNGTQAVLQNGQLRYEEHAQANGAITFNTMSTPKGRQFQVALPDGTRVWLNAASSIRYPTSFTGSERSVQIMGEAYFEVAKNQRQPFIVQAANGTEIRVLGTRFNVNAYDNEPVMNTTLLEGAVRVQKGREQTELYPGEQAQVSAHIRTVKEVDTDQVMAWKSGQFNFKNVSLQEIMRQLERWYDIEVAYENGVPDVPLMGKITRDVSLNGLLKNLKSMGVRTKLDGRKLMVLQGK